MAGEDFSGKIEPKAHYTYLTNALIEAFNSRTLPDISDITIEPDYGYFSIIHYIDGTNRVIFGHDPGLNSGASEQLANDKGYSKFVLRQLGIKCPIGKEFLLPWWATKLRETNPGSINEIIETTTNAADFITDKIGYPAYIKPINGSQGNGVHQVYKPYELEDIFLSYETQRVKVAVVEQSVRMPDYRLLVFNGKLVNAYERTPLSIIGNGKHSILALIEQKNHRFIEQNRKVNFDRLLPQIVRFIGNTGLNLNSVPDEGDFIRLLETSNLSTGGEPIDVTDRIDGRWKDLAVKIASAFNLKICGVDLACENINSPESDYSVIEVNATPGSKHFMESGSKQREKLAQLFMKFFGIIK